MSLRVLVKVAMMLNETRTGGKTLNRGARTIAEDSVRIDAPRI
jgi:hypothetical protein